MGEGGRSGGSTSTATMHHASTITGTTISSSAGAAAAKNKTVKKRCISWAIPEERQPPSSTSSPIPSEEGCFEAEGRPIARLCNATRCYRKGDYVQILAGNAVKDYLVGEYAQLDCFYVDHAKWGLTLLSDGGQWKIFEPNLKPSSPSDGIMKKKEDYCRPPSHPQQLLPLPQEGWKIRRAEEGVTSSSSSSSSFKRFPSHQRSSLMKEDDDCLSTAEENAIFAQLAGLKRATAAGVTTTEKESSSGCCTIDNTARRRPKARRVVRL